MKAIHYNDNPNSDFPDCKVRRGHAFIMTDNLDDVTCKSCLRWQAHIRHDVNVLARIYA